MNDQQFDRLIRASLSWQADRAVAAQPPMQSAVGRLADRIGSAPSERVRFRPVFLSGRPTFARLILVAALLLAAIGAGLFVGALLRERFAPEPPRRPFGYAAACSTDRLTGGTTMLFWGDEETTYVYPDGRLLTDVSSPTMADSPPTPPRADIVLGTGYRERRLSARGIELMVGRVTDAGLTDGCHTLRSTNSRGGVLATGGPLPAGHAVGATWSPDAGQGREMTAAEEMTLSELVDDLANPSTWLPDDAWIQRDEVLVRPNEWQIVVSLAPTGLGPADKLTLPGGGELDGTDPRYNLVVLPGNVPPAEFGQPAGTAQGRTFRCGVVSRADALDVAESLDSLEIGYDSFSEDGWMREGWGGGLFTSDLSQAVGISIYPEGTLPGRPEVSCATIPAAEPSSPPTSRPAPVTGDLADVDPCSFVPADVAALRVERPSRINDALPARECALHLGNYIGVAANVRLYPSSVDLRAARDVVWNTLGSELHEEQVDGMTVFANSCYAGPDKCVAGVAISAPPYLLFVTAQPYVGKLVVRTVVDGVLASLSDGQP